MRCPKCRTLTLVPAGVAGDAGRLVSCPRCAATWVSRPGSDAFAAGAGRLPMVRKAPLTIEGAGPTGRAGRARALRAGLLATGAIMILALFAALAVPPGVSARPDTALAELAR